MLWHEVNFRGLSCFTKCYHKDQGFFVCIYYMFVQRLKLNRTHNLLPKWGWNMKWEKWRKITFNPLGQCLCVQYTKRHTICTESVRFSKGKRITFCFIVTVPHLYVHCTSKYDVCVPVRLCVYVNVCFGKCWLKWKKKWMESVVLCTGDVRTPLSR